MADAGRIPSALRSWASGLVGLAVALGVWKLAILYFGIRPFFMPPPEAVIQAIALNGRAIAVALFATLSNALVGLAIAFVIAIALASLFTASPLALRATLPIVIGLRTTPVLAVAPILIMIFGRGLGTSIAVVVIVSFFPIMVNAMRGFTATPQNALELMHMLGATTVTTFARVRAPFALPYIFTGLRSASTSAVLAAMLAEWLSGAPGLGSMILDASSLRRSALLWAVVAVSMATAFVIFLMTDRLERRLVVWRHNDRSSR
jgi:NitT/TauT family transport system permease protein